MTASPLPSGPFSVRAKEPGSLGSSDQVMIDEDGFHFGTAMDTEGAEWEHTLSFSEITELRYKPTSGFVSGTLRNGNELRFRIDQGTDIEGAMRAVVELVNLEVGASNWRSYSMSIDEQAVAAILIRFEHVFEMATERGAGPQVRRFVYLTAAAGLEVEKVESSSSLTARRPDTGGELLTMWWYSRSRCNFLVGPGLSEIHGAEAVHALPKTKVLRKMDMAETDRFLDSLESLFDVRSPGDAPDNGEHRETVDASSRAKPLSDIGKFPVPAPRSGFHRSVPGGSDVSREELAAALGVLSPAFRDAAMCGVEAQAERFVKLTVAADLEVRWVEELRVLSANWRKTGQALFLLKWNAEGQVTGHLGIEEKRSRNEYVRVDLFEKAFGLRYTKDAGTLPEMDYPSTMSSVEINRYTDSFLDWLETFLATYAVPSRQAEAMAEPEEDNSTDAMMAVLYSVMSFLWIGLIWFSVVWTSGGLGSTTGDVQAEVVLLGVFYLVVPVGVLIHSLKVRRAIRRSGSHQGTDTARGAVILAVLAIALALVLTVAELIRNS